MTERAPDRSGDAGDVRDARMEHALEAAFAEEQKRSPSAPRRSPIDARLELAIEGVLATIDELEPRH